MARLLTANVILFLATVSLASDTRELLDWLHYSALIRINEYDRDQLREMIYPEAEIRGRIEKRYRSAEDRGEWPGIFLTANCVDITEFSSALQPLYGYLCQSEPWSGFAAFASLSADRYGVFVLARPADVARTVKLLGRLQAFWEGEREHGVAVSSDVFERLRAAQKILQAGGLRDAA